MTNLFGGRVALGAALLALAAAPLAAQDSAGTAAPPAPKVSVGGVIYTQYEYLLSDDEGDGNGFDVNRAYLTLTGKFSEGVGGRITTDVYRVADNSLAIRLKYAYASWVPANSAVGFRLGMTQTPWVDYEETLWGYRMQGTIALDRNGYLTSSDFGVAADGAWNRDAVNFTAGLYNGEGYSRGTGDKRKDVAARASVRLLETDDLSRVGGLRVTGFGHLGTPTGGGRRNRFAGMVSYKSRALTLAGVFAATRDRDSVATESTPGRVISTFGVVRIPNTRAAVIGRVDVVDPDTDLDDDRRTTWIAGVSYAVGSNLVLLADLENISYQGGFPSAEAEAEHSRALVQAQVTF